MSESKVYESEFSDNKFWNKAVSYAKVAGREVIEKALWLYFAAQRPETPAWAKAAIYAALGYFIFPLDALPDPTPVLGYADDLGVLAAAIASVSLYIDDTVKVQAAEKLDDWFK